MQEQEKIEFICHENCPNRIKNVIPDISLFCHNPVFKMVFDPFALILFGLFVLAPGTYFAKQAWSGELDEKATIETIGGLIGVTATIGKLDTSNFYRKHHLDKK